MVAITLYTKPGCHLCEDVADQLEALAEAYALRIEPVDITRDWELHRRYWDKIPVVVIGQQTLQAPIAPADLEQAVQTAARIHTT